MTSTVSCLACTLPKTSRSLGSLLGSPRSRVFLPGRGERGGVVFALADVQAEVDVDVAGVDHVRCPSVVLARPCHGTDRHTHITKSLPTWENAGGHAPNQRSVSAFRAGDTTPGPCARQGEVVMPTPKAGSPVAGLRRR
jgi:hypothetical protein